MNVKKDLPAFPLQSGQALGLDKNGLTKREYYAMHAPVEVPDWFKPKVEPRPIGVKSMHQMFGNISTHRYKDYFVGANGKKSHWDGEEDQFFDPENEVPEEFKKEVEDHLASYLDYRERVELWTETYNREQYFQWRWYWADQMLEMSGREL